MDRRIRVPKEYEELVERLLAGSEEDYAGPFRTKADIMAFAAALGAAKGEPIPFDGMSGDPIRKDVFIKSGYSTLIDLLAVSRTNDPKVLSSSDEMENERAEVFEGFANRGFAVLQRLLEGDVNYLDGLLVILMKTRTDETKKSKSVDIASLLD